jgi:hypothetical protein
MMMNPDEPTPAMQNPDKDPEDWTTGDEPMTGPQRRRDALVSSQ